MKSDEFKVGQLLKHKKCTKWLGQVIKCETERVLIQGIIGVSGIDLRKDSSHGPYELRRDHKDVANYWIQKEPDFKEMEKTTLKPASEYMDLLK